MARKVHLDTAYIFVPASNRITIDKAIPQEKLLLITNLSTNTVVYNFSDPNLKVNSYFRTRDTMIAVTGNPGGNTVTNLWPTVTPRIGQRITGYGIPQNTYISDVQGTVLTLTKSDGSAANLTADPYINQHTPATIFGTVITLAYNTSGMNAADKLQIFVDEYEETTRPAEVYTDPVSKQRMSTPQALIDTDFELGLQPTKWESLQLISNRPSFFYNITTPIQLNTTTTTNGSRTVAVDVKAPVTGQTSTATANANVTGTGTRFLTELLPGSVLYNAAGTFVGYVNTTTSDTAATLKANGVSNETNIAAFATGQRFTNNGAPGTGIFSGTGTISNTVSTTGVTGTSTRFLTEIRPGDFIFNQAGAFVGQVSTIASDTSLTLTSASTNGATAAYGVSQYTPSSTVAGAGFGANPIYVLLTSNASANGSFLITGPTAPANIGASTTFNYEMDSAALSTGSILDAPVTYMYPGTFYDRQQLGGATSGVNFATDAATTFSTITVTLQGSNTHGLSVGSPIFVAGTSSTAANGNFFVASIISPTAFTYVTQATVATITAAQGRVYARPIGLTTHRPTDGGIKITAGVNAPNHQMIRQSRRYFRYQSGKGIQYSTGTVLQPSIFVNTITSASSIITVNCREPHFLYPGAIVSISGAINSGAGSFNGLWTVLAPGLTDTTFTVTTNTIGATTYTAPSTNQTAGGFPINVSVRQWVGAQTRLGLFDNQNGMFFKFDGTTLYTVRRSSTDVLSGRVTVTANSSTVTGINTLFSTQLKPGNNVVIRGQTYTVATIANDTSMTIVPEYRGTNIAGNGAWIMKTIDLEIPQTDWNIDRCDGTGPSGYSLDLQRMQMYYIDYSWYGAGAIRFGFKDQKGEVIYVNRIAHANTKTEAYMRSGNLPARYETNTLTPSTILTATLSNATGSGGTIQVQDVSQWPSTGFALIQGSTGTGELIEYSAKSTANPNTLTIANRTFAGSLAGITNCSTTSGSNTVTSVTNASTVVQRFMHVHGAGIPIGTYVVGVTGTTVYLNNAANATSATATLFFKPHTQTSAAATGAAQTFTYSATSPTSVSFYNPQFAPNISHWGSSVIMDGRYDDDKSLIFTAGMPSALSIPAAAVANVAGQPVALVSIRISPSVDSGLGDLLGRKEIINRMQLALASCGVTTDRRLLVDLRLNGQLSAGTWQSFGGSSLSQISYHANNTFISGGESVFSFYTSNQGGGTFSVSSFDLSKARDLGNSVLGGGTSLNVSQTYYPDGPDILTLVVRNLETTTANTLCRVSWTEAQA